MRYQNLRRKNGSASGKGKGKTERDHHPARAAMGEDINQKAERRESRDNNDENQ